TLESGGRAIVPGNLEDSELWQRINSDDEFLRMPPAEHRTPLSTNEKHLIQTWIQQGAAYQTHWAFKAPQRPELPSIRFAQWPRNTIDYYILAKLEDQQLRPAEEADREDLIRRLAFDLTGLPPTLEDIDIFLADDSPSSYENLVEKYLSSPSYGENMASVWLDLARYADTNGYQYDTERQHWVWRDWVIHAYNQNKPFDQFTTDQIAGDLIPNATANQLLATGFNRNHGITIEGGVIGEEYRTEYVMDRLITTTSVWMGLTVGCARCHDHKYDPLSQQEFYELYACFNLVPEKGQSGFQPQMQLASPLAEHRLAATASRIANLQRELPRAKNDLSGLEPWAASLAKQGVQWRVLKAQSINSSGGTTITPQTDHSLLVSGVNPHKDIYTFTFETDQVDLTALRLECLTHPSLPGGGPGRHTNSNFVLTGIELTATSRADPNQTQNITFRNARADYNQARYHVMAALDSSKSTGWAVDGPTRKKPATAIFETKEPFGYEGGTVLTLTLKHEATFGTHGVGRPRISISSTPVETLSFTGMDAVLVDAAKISEDKRTEQQAQLLTAFYQENIGPAKKLEQEIKRLQQLQSTGFPATMIMKDQPGIRKTHILNRGQYNEPTKEVHFGTPAALPPMKPTQAANRLGFAQWLTSKEHPLTSRVAVNRYWQLFFGNGLVKTSEDFGNQGSPPSHPQLLDYLALEFIESEWDIKQLHRLIVTSATYRQSSKVGRAKYLGDPENIYLSRGPRMRLTAEQVRDNALSVSGLLLNTLGGSSVYPYQPKGIWLELNNRPGYSRAYPQGKGEQLYRRSLYTFWKRTVPSPMMKTLDAPEREFCTLKRAHTNTPLQSLLLLNGIQFVEAARHMAVNLLQLPLESDRHRMIHAFRQATGRTPDDEEIKLLTK
ncbi:MAG: PSD1 and planctomycete cytochrome C domain-containing protein, partial [Planctomycetota bacterium]|nr:PSD1 and planctomycete cytochrome C domain-containing protein [Planctomycetota bacterium]